MIRILLFCLSFAVLFVFNLGAKDDLDNLKTQYNRYLIDSSYKNFVENFNRLDDPIAFEKAEFSWRDKFLYNNKVINLPCAYIMHLQDQFLRSTDKKQAGSIAHLLKLTQIDGFYFTYQKQTVTKRQAQILSLMFERSNIFTNILDQKSDNIYAKAVNQHFYLVKNDHKKLQEWHDIKDSNKFNDNLWINLGNLGDTTTKKRIDLIKGLSLSERDVLPQFVLKGFKGEDSGKKLPFYDWEKNEKLRRYRLFDVDIDCEFCDRFCCGKEVCSYCKKYPFFEKEYNSRVSYTTNVKLRQETDEIRINPARWWQEEYMDAHIERYAWGTKRVVKYYKKYRDHFIPETTERLVKVTTSLYEFSSEQKIAIRQDLSKQSIMFKKKRLAYLLYYLKNHPALKFRREIFAEIGEYLLEYKRHEDTFFKSIKPAFLLKEATADVWERV
jgi:hypothetical protein